MKIDRFARIVEGRELPLQTEPGVISLYEGSDASDPARDVMFLCPCGCERLVCLPAAPGEKQPGRWLLKLEGDEITLSPSIKDHVCGAHYFIRASRVVWT